jgi:hypothetical protein
VSLGCIRYLSSKHEHFVKFTGYAKNEQSGKKTHFEVIEHIRQGTTYKLIFMFIYIIVIGSNEEDYKNKKQQQVHDERQPRGMIHYNIFVLPPRQKSVAKGQKTVAKGYENGFQAVLH